MKAAIDRGRSRPIPGRCAGPPASGAGHPHGGGVVEPQLRAVLRAAGIHDLFDVRVDGLVASRAHLPGKPAPDTFLKAAEMLGVRPGRAVVVEDAIAGVEAGRAGGFGLVVGVDREGERRRPAAHGADVVADRSCRELLTQWILARAPVDVR